MAMHAKIVMTQGLVRRVRASARSAVPNRSKYSVLLWPVLNFKVFGGTKTRTMLQKPCSPCAQLRGPASPVREFLKRSRPSHYRRHCRSHDLIASEATHKPTTPSSISSSAPVVATGSREYLSLFPPFFYRTTKLEEFQPGLWGLTQPLALSEGKGFDVRLRMTVAKLADGSLLLVGPVAPTDELLNMLWAIEGDVKHIVIPNTSPEHWYFAPALAKRFPAATVWTVPGFFESGKRPPFPPLGLRSMQESSVCKELGVDPLPVELEGEIETVVFEVPLFTEAAIVLPRYKALLLADTALLLDPEEYAGAGNRIIESAKESRIWGRLGPSITKVAFQRRAEEGRRWVEAVLQHDFDMVVVGHASAPAPGGREAFRQAFDFIY